MSVVGILGGGLVGRLTALQLARQGQKVELFDMGEASGDQSAAYIAAAMLAPSAESIDATPEVVALGRQSLPMWRKLTASLEQPVFMQEKGSLIVWHSQDRPLAEQFIRQLDAQSAHYEHWNATDIAEQEPQLAGRFAQAWFLPGEGQLENRQLLAALAHELSLLNVPCHWQQSCERLDMQHRFDWVIDCRGVDAKPDWHQAGNSRLRGVRGEVLRVRSSEVSLNRPIRMLHPRYPLYIAPKPDQVFVVGATQIESESRQPATVRAGLELLSALYAVHPAFGEAQMQECQSGLRPTLEHHNPEIRFDTEKRLIEINGLFRHGFMIAPAVTDAACRLLNALLSGGEIPEYGIGGVLPYTRLQS